MDDPVIITNQKIKEHPSPDTPNTPDTPDTGDRDPVSKVILLMCFAVVSVAGIVFTGKIYRRIKMTVIITWDNVVDL